MTVFERELYATPMEAFGMRDTIRSFCFRTNRGALRARPVVFGGSVSFIIGRGDVPEGVFVQHDRSGLG